MLRFVAFLVVALASCKPAAEAPREQNGGKAVNTTESQSADSTKDQTGSMTDQEQAANDQFIGDSFDDGDKGAPPNKERKKKTGKGERSTEKDSAKDDDEGELDAKDDDDDLDEDNAEACTDKKEDDEGTVDDLMPFRLDQMVQMILDKADKDDDGALNLDEMLSGPLKGGKKWKKKHEKISKWAEKKRKKLFEKFAGDDKLLSEDELKESLKESCKWVKKNRKKWHHGKHEDRKKQSWEDIIAEFDKDDDGKLDQKEYEAIQASKQERADRWKKRKGRHHKHHKRDKDGEDDGFAPMDGVDFGDAVDGEDAGPGDVLDKDGEGVDAK